MSTTRYEKGHAPRVTEQEVDQAIVKQDFTVLPDGRTTICTLTLYNGFTVRGESSCVRIENFDEMIGRECASRKARDEVWKILGFRLAENLYWVENGAKILNDGIEASAKISKALSEAKIEGGAP